MNPRFQKFVILSACALLFLLPLSVRVVFAADCVKIAIIAGPKDWVQTDTKTPYTVQAQDSAGVKCAVSETLRLSFESSAGGAFTGKDGTKPALASIYKGDANRNFYYQHAAGASDVITIKAGYGTDKDNWSVVWETFLNTSASLSANKTDAVFSGSPTTRDAVKVQTKDTSPAMGLATTTQTSNAREANTSGSGALVASSEVAAVPLAKTPPREQKQTAREPSQTQKNEQPLSSLQKADTKEKTLALTTPSVSETTASATESPAETDAVGTTTAAEKTDDLSHEGQLSAVATHEQTGALWSGWVAPLAFVGVLCMGILALSVHKIM